MAEKTLELMRSSLGVILVASFILMFLSFGIMGSQGLFATHTLQRFTESATNTVDHLNQIQTTRSKVYSYLVKPDESVAFEIENHVHNIRKNISEFRNFTQDTDDAERESMLIKTFGNLASLEDNLNKVRQEHSKREIFENEIKLMYENLDVYSKELASTFNLFLSSVEPYRENLRAPSVKLSLFNKIQASKNIDLHNLKTYVQEGQYVKAIELNDKIQKNLRAIHYIARGRQSQLYDFILERVQNVKNLIHEDARYNNTDLIIKEIVHIQNLWNKTEKNIEQKLIQVQVESQDKLDETSEAIMSINYASKSLAQAMRAFDNAVLNINEFFLNPTEQKSQAILKEFNKVKYYAQIVDSEIKFIFSTEVYNKIKPTDIRYSLFNGADSRLTSINRTIKSQLDRYKVQFIKQENTLADLAQTSDELFKNVVSLVDNLETQADFEAQQARQSIGVGLVIGIFASLGALYLIVFQVLKPIRDLTNTLQKISTGDLEVDLNSERSDEIGAMMRAAHVFKDNLVELQHVAWHDTLTDLPNRAAFNDIILRISTESMLNGTKFAVHMIDLDKFKEINDIHGHPSGDEVIIKTASRIQRTLRKGDFVARLGGDEFAVIQIGNINDENVQITAKRIIEAATKPITLKNSATVAVGASVGAAIFPDHSKLHVDLVAYADTALYFSKNAGRGIASIYKPEMDKAIRERKEIETELDIAIAEDQFELFYQPRIDFKAGKITSYEALIRWRHPQKGLISPGVFIPVAEDSSRIVDIGNIVLRKALEDVKDFDDDVRVSVNVSPLQFRDPHLISNIETALIDSEVEPRRLEIEITENVLIEDDAHAGQMLNAIKMLGIDIALDDFGTGYSSLGYLSRFPFDTLKIDQSFIRDLFSSENNMAIVQTIISLADSINISVVAEGVEDKEVFEYLRDLGCDEIQGYYIGKPMPKESRLTSIPEDILVTMSTSQDKKDMKIAS